MASFRLTGRGRRRLLSGHPWVYADDVASGEAEPGALVPIFSPNDEPLGWGLFSAQSKIALRAVTRLAAQPDRAFWLARIRGCVEARAALGLLDPAGACRLIAGDAEGLPGLIVDRYARTLVLQSSCQGSDRMLSFLLELVLEALPFEVDAVLDRSDASVRRHEALEPRVEWISGGGGEPVLVVEEGPAVPRLEYEVDVLQGHKTGHYLDQRQNRIVAARFASDARVLDVFSYDGLFGIRAALAGARSVLCLDQNDAAGERLRRNAERNGVADRVAFERVKALDDLRRRVEGDERYDVVVLDPPAFARSKREAEGALRGYRELNRRGLELTRTNGVLVTASCSYNVGRREFRQALAEAALAAGDDTAAHVFRFAGAAPDHPSSASLPESDYLKCAFVRVGR